ncbi:MAG: DNA polymerase III subunit beta [Opitutia bacterium]
MLQPHRVMKFKVNRNHFFNGLATVTNIVGARVTMPILQNVLIEAEGDCITLTTTIIDISVSAKVKATVSTPGRITLPVKRLATIARALPSAEVTVELMGKDRVKVGSGSSTFQITGMGAEQFPPIAAFSGQSSSILDQEALGAILRKVSYAQSTDENRYILNGVFLEFEADKLNVVATDGRRLAKSELARSGAAAAAGLILPARTIAELSRLLKTGKVTFSHNERQVGFEIEVPKNDEGLVDRVLLISRVVEGNYPNYRQVIPKDTGFKIRLEREKFLEAVQRAALMIDERSNTVHISVSKASQRLEISARSAAGEASEPIAVKYDGADIAIAFNPTYLVEPLKAVTEDEIDLEVKSDTDAGVLRGIKEPFLCVVMPQRVTA